LTTDEKSLTHLENIKQNSRYLRGTIEESLEDRITGAVAADDAQLLKFHGTYQQDDRDVRNERRRQKLEPAYQFMVRVRVPGGICTPEQWLQLDELARDHADGSLRLTTRQAFQLHGIVKWNLKETIKHINDSLLSTIAACGDVNRNVMCNPNPERSEIHREVYEWASRVSDRLTPQTPAYHEIWLNKEKIVDSREEIEPIYGPSYMPRKFKLGVAIPPSNDVDIYSQDLGFVAVVENQKPIGFNVIAGGGMGMTHGEPETYPELGRLIGFCPVEAVVDVAEQIVKIQRDYGDRTNRKHARLKYTINDRGVEWFQLELNERLGWELAEPKEFEFTHMGDRLGWTENADGSLNYTLFIQSGRIRDWDGFPMMTGIREIAKIHTGDFRLTPNQNLMIGRISQSAKREIEALIEAYKLSDGTQISAMRRNSLACVAMPTCGLAMAEAERYLPELLNKLEEVLDEVGLRDDEIVVRMTGCPNGCARPYLGEIGFVGKGPGKYNLYLGAGFSGDRLNKLYRENIGEDEIMSELKSILAHYASDRKDGERFGDFVIRAGYVRAVTSGRDFHA